MSSKPIIVIIPGGFCSPKAYTLLRTTLQSRGYQTYIVPLKTCPVDFPQDIDPSSPEWKALSQLTPLDDAEEVHAVLRPFVEAGREAVLVGHSYGSLPMLAACQGWTTVDRKAEGLKGGIKGVVYLAGFTHAQRGKGIMANTELLPTLPYHSLKDGILTLLPTATPLFFSDIPPQDQASAAEEYTLRHMTRSAFAFYPEYIDSDIPVRKTWILTEGDAVVPPAMQEMFAQGGGVQHVVRVQGGHFGLVREAGDVVDGIVGASEA